MLKVDVPSNHLTSVHVGVGSTQSRLKASRQVIHQDNSNLSLEIYTNGPRLLTKGDPYLKEFSLSFCNRKQCIDVTRGPPGMSR